MRVSGQLQIRVVGGSFDSDVRGDCSFAAVQSGLGCGFDVDFDDLFFDAVLQSAAGFGGLRRGDRESVAVDRFRLD